MKNVNDISAHPLQIKYYEISKIINKHNYMQMGRSRANHLYATVALAWLMLHMSWNTHTHTHTHAHAHT